MFVKVSASWVAELNDTEPQAPVPVTWLQNLRVVPYGTVEWVDMADNDNFGNLQPQWGVGTDILLDSGGDFALFTEYSSGDLLPDDVYLGLRGTRS